MLGQHHSEEAHLSHSFTSGMHYQKDLEAIKDESFGSHGLPALRVGLGTIQTERAPPEIKKQSLKWIQDRETNKGVPLEASIGGRQQTPMLASYLAPPKEPP